MEENFNREVMWRLSTNSNSVVDKLMSTLQMRHEEGTKG